MWTGWRASEWGKVNSEGLTARQQSATAAQQKPRVRVERERERERAPSGLVDCVPPVMASGFLSLGRWPC